MAFCLTSFMTIYSRLENARRDRIAAAVTEPEELTEQQKALEAELADNVPWFRYQI